MTPPAAKLTQNEKNQALLDVDHLKVGIGKRTTRGATIVMGAQLVRIGVQLTTTFFLARLLVPADFGLVALGITVLGLLNLFTDLGLTSITVQIKKLDQNTASALFFINVALGTLALLAVIAASPALAWIFRNENVALVAIGLATSTPINALGAQHQAILMRNMRWGQTQGLGLTSMTTGSVAAVIAAWLFDLGYWALVIQAIVSAATQVAGVWLICPWRPSFVRSWTGVREAIGTSVNLSGSMVLGYLHRQFDNMLIGWRWGAAELGYYARGYSLLMMPLNLVTGPLSSAMIPALSRLQDEPVRWRQAYLDALILVTALGGGLAAILFGGASPIIELVLGPGWQKSEDVFSSLSLALLAATPMNTVSWIYISLGRSRRMLLWGVIGTSTYVAAFLIGLPFGAVGVALAYGIAQISAFLPCMWMATRHTSTSLADVLKAILPVMTITVIVGLSLRYIADGLGLVPGLLATALAGVAYVGLFALLCLNWPPHRRVRARAIGILQGVLSHRRPARIEAERAARGQPGAREDDIKRTADA
ncbi:MAG: lipopolysaccharide biosynthesis protein [Hyphomonadaceae bacterium]